MSNTEKFLYPDQTLFYSIEKAIKLYRRYAQARLKQMYPGLTIDQLLILSKMEQNEDISHIEMSQLIFKDIASISRILSSLEEKKLLKRKLNPANKRRFLTRITPKGREVLQNLAPFVSQNRSGALMGIHEEEVAVCKDILEKVSTNITALQAKLSDEAIHTL
ncbi:MAG: MarR family transcriptional regulator [Bacteroidota bacterium]